MVYQQELTVRTEGPGDCRDLTAEVARVAAESGIRTGLVHVFVTGSTAAVGLIEMEPGLRQDLPEFLSRLIPAGRGYAHERTWHDGNAHSHLQATLLGQGVTVPLAGGRPLLGTWQQIFLLECDTRPRERMLAVTVLGAGELPDPR